MNSTVNTDLLIDDLKSEFIALSDRILDVPEIRYQEQQSVELQIAALEKAGFTFTRNAANVPTAFMAEAGSDGPVIGFLGSGPIDFRPTA